MKKKRTALKRSVGIIWFYFLLICLFAFNTYADEWDGWTVSNGVWEIGVPTAGPGACHGDGDCAGTVLDGNYPLQDDSRLISPVFELPAISGDEQIELRFWQWFNYDGGDGNDKGYVQVSVWDGSA
ncbi:MAG: hypothetical protein KJ737_07650, partial [Proteobacteria bacterium]|nr:hypothetical protein [Pseudomonadota bacterium]